LLPVHQPPSLHAAQNGHSLRTLPQPGKTNYFIWRCSTDAKPFAQQASSNIASHTPLQALTLKFNFWQKLAEYNEELREKNDHTQMQLREKFGKKYDAVLTRIEIEVYEANVLIELQISAISGYVGYQWLMLDRAKLRSCNPP
jgi:hypothetical protein